MISWLIWRTAIAQECSQSNWDLQSEWVSKASRVRDEKAAEVEALDSYAFTLTGEDTERVGIRTDGLIVLQHGKILYEQYGRGFAQDNKHLLWSVTKSINSALLGRAVYENLIDIDVSICTQLKQVPEKIGLITAEHLVTFFLRTSLERKL